MLPNTEVENPSAIETHVCQKIKNANFCELDNETGSLLFQLLYINKDGDKFKLEQKEKPFLFQVAEKRIEFCFQYRIKEHALLLFLCSLAENPAVMVMYLWYLQYWAKNNNTKEIDLITFCQKIFPSGFPSSEAMSEIWQSQKVDRKGQSGSDNLVDYATAGKSLQF